MSPQQIWQVILGELELTLSKANFTTWFKNTFIGEFTEHGDVVVCVPSTFYKTWLERRFHQTLIKLIEKTSGKPIRTLNFKVGTGKTNLPFVVNNTDQNSLTETQPEEKPSLVEFKIPNYTFATPPSTLPINQNTINNTQTSSNFSQKNEFSVLDTSLVSYTLNPKHTFEGFVVGKGSELAHAAAQAVAARPGEAYNPLFIYGGVGLGKTHLMQAIGNSVLAKDTSKRVIYTSSERFTNEYIHSIRSGKGKEFKDLYRNVDLLIIDDIQFISGKESTQEEFFHTFNTLHQNNKQVVISSDRPPKAIKLLESRLLSRFEWGMIADVAPPDLETRIAILEAKCKEKAYNLEKKIVTLIAELVQNNVRELEGALNKIIAYHELKNTPPTEGLVRSLISNLENYASRKILSPKYVLQVISSFYGVALEDLLGKSREKRLAYPRQIIMYLLREEMKLSFPTIGDELGGRDHTTAMHACDKIRREIDSSSRVRETITQLKQQLYAA
ncbi:MAG: Chromosomal replication initiator protein DnaA [Candidatus Magasanikbacteria bacterium GW2011_GWC2_45_8]|uniref:Chromosomal replication initiator protein DnaA n=1 Tax=Candidatus Magasanikbacteria bacterium GW2011_GWC2_45_8 TaxID=1619050 RepID=A0A0G1Q8I2_9BACT|nr:MAG: Chromosomal replication initiator protein DnaA [Candidatus Magasanikbacteria bacterium GW2011_GWC2_45_8]HBW73839.1 chromosomal replication initiator protein DnaA [Candidatus Magasanikbacteria bacterium]